MNVNENKNETSFRRLIDGTEDFAPQYADWTERYQLAHSLGQMGVLRLSTKAFDRLAAEYAEPSHRRRYRSIRLPMAQFLISFGELESALAGCVVALINHREPRAAALGLVGQTFTANLRIFNRAVPKNWYVRKAIDVEIRRTVRLRNALAHGSITHLRADARDEFKLGLWATYMDGTDHPISPRIIKHERRRVEVIADALRAISACAIMRPNDQIVAWENMPIVDLVETGTNPFGSALPRGARWPGLLTREIFGSTG